VSRESANFFTRSSGRGGKKEKKADAGRATPIFLTVNNKTAVAATLCC